MLAPTDPHLDLNRFDFDPELIGRRIDELTAEANFFRRLLVAAHHLRAIRNRTQGVRPQVDRKAVADAR